jgi:hypothetical protein
MYGALESVRLRVFFKQRCPLLAANSEYTDSSSLMRARLRFTWVIERCSSAQSELASTPGLRYSALCKGL